MKKQKNPISSDAYAYLKTLIHPTIKIVDLYVEGRYLKAELDSGVRFAIKNQRID